MSLQVEVDSMIRRAVVLAIWLPAGLSACDDNGPGAVAPETGVDSPRAMAPGAVSESREAESIDWAAGITASRMKSIESMGVLMRLVRYLTYWHNGNRRVILVRFRSDGYAIDDSGNSIPMSAAQWKGMLNLIETTELKPMPALTPSRPSLPDDLGRLSNLVYEVETDDDARIQFTCLGPYEG